MVRVIEGILLPPQGFRPEAKSRGGTLATRAYIKVSTYSSNIQSVYQKKTRFARTGAARNRQVIMTFYCLRPQVRNGQGDVKTENSERTTQVDFVTFIVQSYFDTLLRYAVTFCGAVVLKVMDQKTLVKRRGGYKVRLTVYI